MAIDPRLYSGKRELCKDCGAVDGNGNPTSCQQGCPASYLPHLAARRRKPAKTERKMRWRSLTLMVEIALVIENLEWVMAQPKDSIRIEIDAGRRLASVMILSKGVKLEAMRRFQAPGFRP